MVADNCIGWELLFLPLFSCAPNYGQKKEDKLSWWWNEEEQDTIKRKRSAKKKWHGHRDEL